MEEGLGWSSEGWTAEKASIELAELKKAHTVGSGPTRLREKRERAEERKKAKEAQENKEARGLITFGRYFNETYFPIAKTDKKRESYRKEDEHFRTWLKPALGDMPLKKIWSPA